MIVKAIVAFLVVGIAALVYGFLHLVKNAAENLSIGRMTGNEN